MRRTISLLATMALVACGAGADGGDAPATDTTQAAPGVSAEQEAADATIQALATRYADPAAALADGFVRDPSGMCVTADMVGRPASDGAMGIHYLHPARLGLVEGERPTGTDGVIDWTQPEILVYEPQADGSEVLVAVEYLVFADAWAAAGNTEPPSYFGTPFVTMIDDPATEADESHGFDGHHELHVWVPRDNPAGKFAEFNPAVSCEHAGMAQMD